MLRDPVAKRAGHEPVAEAVDAGVGEFVLSRMAENQVVAVLGRP